VKPGDIETEGEEPAPSAGLPRSLEEQMAKDRRDAGAHIAHDPALALDLAIFSLARMPGISAIPIPAAPSASPIAMSPRPDRHSGQFGGDRTRAAAQPAQ
jgi:hypothetical protein